MRNLYPVLNYITNFVTIIPFLYRYENQNYIDEFFNNGNIFISSFHNYKKYSHDELGDKYEGVSMNIAKCDNDLDIGTYTTIGLNEYAFCTSTILDKSFSTKFSRDGVFRIKDPLNFALEITKSIPRVTQVFHGNCIYNNERILQKKVPEANLDTLKNENGHIASEKIMQISNYVGGPDAFFLKHMKYQQQSEYRFIWQTDRLVENGIIINCPEAVKYCERVEL